MPAESSLLRSARTELADYAGRAAGTQRELAGAFLTTLNTHGESALRKDGPPEHLTASFVVFSPAGDTVLLNFHRKADAWGHFGGHLEPADGSLREAAQRECAEESGLTVRSATGAIAEVHAHDLGSGFSRCQRHLDVVFTGVADPSAAFRASDESVELAWFPVSALPERIMPDLPARVPMLAQAVRALRDHS
nr:NUDIX domain-containing protein [Sediminivirga luteola]